MSVDKPINSEEIRYLIGSIILIVSVSVAYVIGLLQSTRIDLVCPNCHKKTKGDIKNAE